MVATGVEDPQREKEPQRSGAGLYSGSHSQAAHQPVSQPEVPFAHLRWLPDLEGRDLRQARVSQQPAVFGALIVRGRCHPRQIATIWFSCQGLVTELMSATSELGGAWISTAFP